MILVPTRFLMTSSSILLAIAGVALLFFPGESLSILGMGDNSQLMAQLFSAAFLGNAAANWLARGSMIGGIYARPLSVANYVHFLIGAFVLVMGLDDIDPGIAYFSVLFVYCVFGVLFALLLFGPHRSNRKP